MAAEVVKGREAWPVREMALKVVRQLRQKDYLGEIAAIHAFVRDRVRYVRDARSIEQLHSAEHLLEQRQGDCDDKTILCLSMLESIGHTTRIKAVGPTRKSFNHVYGQVRHPKRPGMWINLECTEPWAVGVGIRMPGEMIQEIRRAK
ncbi:MAG: hypothetical protein K0S46_2210 [Moraxellaceae bacterium]|jgi:transglutaminase-like putative cysteine protease|nr:hypothetical protein [Moraxellaceae bacterium]